MTLHFILVKPRTPENVGAAARAIKTMGFRSLRLVAPCEYKSGKALWLAHGSNDLLEKAAVFSDLTEATADLDFIIATTARRRHALKHLYHPINKLGGLLQGKQGAAEQIGILFGCEDFGLTNEELTRCDVVTYIPMAQAYPSLNLAQAVMIYAWELSQIAFNKKMPDTERPPEDQFLALKKRLNKLLPELGVVRTSRFFRKAVKRIGLIDKQDIRLLHFLCGRIEATIPCAPTRRKATFLL
ncbi:MAG: tRNA/rRNA methyltransferase [Elusimicrobia bacterium RIFOXYB2_FULL_49_7]|nr:MAG: tRNA/rRNA methyltransferase [Elusimicrobia bacterium RIFOXYB2_FULL_49_7]